jgi:hypothetical protein
MPNWFATISLVLCPLIALALFRVLPVNRALIWTILGGQLLLPVGAAIKFAGIPAFDKYSLPSLAALAGCAMITRRVPRVLHRFGLTELLLLMYLLSPFITSELNGDPIFNGTTFLPAIDQYEALSAAVAQFLFVLPFILGRQFLKTSADITETLRILVIAGLLYSLLMLVEVRVSPQLHLWVYGYSAISYAVEMRYDGFRPTVFMTNGLVVAFFTTTAVVAAAAFWRTRGRVTRISPGGVTAYLGAVLVLCKSLGALIYAGALVPLIRFTTPRLQLRIALILVTVAMAFPLLRSLDVFPTVTLDDITKSIDNDRAQSLQFRFDQEDQLLRHASERILFGWGRFGRNRVFDQDTGKDLSVTDGRWIITIGQFGVIGFLAEFGLLALPVFRAASALKFVDPIDDRVVFAALALILAINMIDLLPNAPLTPWTWLLAGALLGRAEALGGLARRQQKPMVNRNIHGTKARGRADSLMQRRSAEHCNPPLSLS